MTIDIATGAAALVGLFSLFLSGRALLAPASAAVGFGVPAGPHARPYMAIKGGRDLGLGLVILVLAATARAHPLGWTILAAAVIPVTDGVVVLRSGGPRAVAYGIHWVTAAIMAGIAAALLTT
jgi:Domain of unknown function (DUF4267)